MNTIAVLTDLSEKSAHAARFALHMAKKMKVNAVFFGLSAIPAARQPQLAVECGGLTENEPFNGNELAEFTQKMELDLKKRTFPDSYLPEISFNAESTEMVDVMTTIVNDKRISLVVAAPSGDGDLESFLLSEICSRIIEWATVPVLVVPENAAIRNFEKIAFVTHLHEGDICSIADLSKLTEAFAAELMIAHLNENPMDDQQIKAERKLNNELYKTPGCYGAYFRSIPDTQKQKDWEWLIANKKTDLLAVMHGTRNQMTKFFNRGRNLHATYHLTLPVMVLPKRP